MPLIPWSERGTKSDPERNHLHPFLVSIQFTAIVERHFNEHWTGSITCWEILSTVRGMFRDERVKNDVTDDASFIRVTVALVLTLITVSSSLFSCITTEVPIWSLFAWMNNFLMIISPEKLFYCTENKTNTNDYSCVSSGHFISQATEWLTIKEWVLFSLLFDLIPLSDAMNFSVELKVGL